MKQRCADNAGDFRTSPVFISRSRTCKEGKEREKREEGRKGEGNEGTRLEGRVERENQGTGNERKGVRGRNRVRKVCNLVSWIINRGM